MQEIKIIVGKGGKINFGVKGVKGTSCKELTEKFQKALGKTIKSTNTEEYYEQNQKSSQNQTLGGYGEYNG